MTALDEYRVAQATESHARDLLAKLEGSESFTRDDADVLCGLIVRAFGAGALPVSVSEVLEEAEDAVSEAIDEIRSVSSFRLEDAASQIRAMRKRIA